MLKFEKDQKVIQIGKVKIGGQPGENPIVLVGSVFYRNHDALLDEKTGKIDEKLVEQEINEFLMIIDETGMQAIIDVIGGYGNALIKECSFIADICDQPFLVDGLNDESRIPAMEGLKELGLLDRAILNSIDDHTKVENLAKFKEYGVKNALLLTFGNRYIYPEQKLKFLKEKLIPKAQMAGIENILVDTAVLDLPSICINVDTTRLVKNELGLPTGFAPSNAIYGWDFIKKFGENARFGAISSLMTYCADAGSDFILFGPVKYAKYVVPSIAMISGINSYYRKRVLREKISDLTPMKLIF